MTSTQGFRGALATQVIVAGSEGQILVYDGTPAFGNLILSISSVPGTDDFGNTYLQGLNLVPIHVPGGPTIIEWAINEASTYGEIFANTFGNPGLWLKGPDDGSFNQSAIGLLFGTQGIVIDPQLGGLQIDQGAPGLYYTEIVTIGSASIVSGTPTDLVNLSHAPADCITRSGYGSAFNTVTGIWTCPVTGEYDCSCFVTYGGWTVGSDADVILTSVSGTYGTDVIGQASSANNTGDCVCTLTAVPFTVGDTVKWQCRQNTGVNRALNRASTRPRIRMARRL